MPSPILKRLQIFSCYNIITYSTSTSLSTRSVAFFADCCCLSVDGNVQQGVERNESDSGHRSVTTYKKTNKAIRRSIHVFLFRYAVAYLWHEPAGIRKAGKRVNIYVNNSWRSLRKWRLWWISTLNFPHNVSRFVRRLTACSEEWKW